jgi:hypothetical protein
MITPVPDSINTEILRFLWTRDLDPLFWRDGRAGIVSAWYGDLPLTHWIVSVAKPSILVELSTHNGVSYSGFCEAVLRAGLDTRCFAVDTSEGDEHAAQRAKEAQAEPAKALVQAVDARISTSRGCESDGASGRCGRTDRGGKC